MATLYTFQFSTEETSVTYFLLDFDQVCGILHDFIRACISDSLAFGVALPFNEMYSTFQLYFTTVCCICYIILILLN